MVIGADSKSIGGASAGDAGWTLAPAVSRDPTLTQGLLMDAEERPSVVSDNSADRLGTIAYRVADRVRSARPTDVDSPKR